MDLSWSEYVHFPLKSPYYFSECLRLRTLWLQSDPQDWRCDSLHALVFSRTINFWTSNSASLSISIGSFLDIVNTMLSGRGDILMIYFHFVTASLLFTRSCFPALAFPARQIIIHTRHTYVRRISLFPHKLYTNRLVPDRTDDFSRARNDFRDSRVSSPFHFFCLSG
jgi:hypothetical protein